MGSHSKSTKSPSTAKARTKKRHRRVLHISVSKAVNDESSIFDDMNDVERVLAFQYYYEHPDELPDRETGAMRRAKEKPLKIRIKFDEAIFERPSCQRPVPFDELDEVDPFTVSTPSCPINGPITPTNEKLDLFGTPSPHHYWTTGMVHHSQEGYQPDLQVPV